jgi:hypothetical protein
MKLLWSYPLLVAVSAYTHNTEIQIPGLPFHCCLKRITRTARINDIIAPIIHTYIHTYIYIYIYISDFTSLKLPKHSPQLKNVSVVINRSCWLLKSVFGSVVVGAFQITFRAKMHANDVFLFFKNHFWHQHIKTIQNIQIILNFSKKKFKFFGNAAAAAFPNVL